LGRGGHCGKAAFEPGDAALQFGEVKLDLMKVGLLGADEQKFADLGFNALKRRFEPGDTLI
jgi:hypothetical protein